MSLLHCRDRSIRIAEIYVKDVVDRRFATGAFVLGIFISACAFGGDFKINSAVGSNALSIENDGQLNILKGIVEYATDGMLQENPQASDFIVQHGGSPIARLDGSTGIFYLKGKVNEEFTWGFHVTGDPLVTLPTSVGSLRFQNSITSDYIAQVTSAGDFHSLSTIVSAFAYPATCSTVYGQISPWMYTDDRFSHTNMYPWKSVLTIGYDRILLNGATGSVSVVNANSGVIDIVPVSGTYEFNIKGLANNVQTAIHYLDNNSNHIGGINVVSLQQVFLSAEVRFINIPAPSSYSAYQIETSLESLYGPTAVRFNVGTPQSVTIANTDSVIPHAKWVDPFPTAGSVTNPSMEIQSIVDYLEQQPNTSTAKLVFCIVTDAGGVEGFTLFGAKYIFISMNNDFDHFTRLMAHEAGHAVGFLPDLYQEGNPLFPNPDYIDDSTRNLMGLAALSTSKWLRHDQWISINQRARIRMNQ